MKKEQEFDPSFAAEVTDADTEPTQETLAHIAGAIERIFATAALRATENSARHNGLELTDMGDKVFLCPEEDNQSDYGLALYKPDSEKSVTEDVIGAYTYYAPDNEHQQVHVTITPSGLSRRFEDTYNSEAMREALAASGKDVLKAASESTSSDEYTDRILETAPDFAEAATKRDAGRVEAEAFEELTGMDKVSEDGAQKLLDALISIEGRLTR